MIKNKNTEWGRTSPGEAFQCPSFATSALPSTNPANGQLAYDSTTGQIKYYTSSAWTNVGTSGSAHAMLSATHSDSTTAAVARGAIITGQGGTPTWTKLTIGAAGTILKSDGTDVSWGALAVGSITLATGALVVGASSVGSALAVGTAAQVLMCNATPIPAWTSFTGDISVGSTGITAIASGVIVNDDINATAGITTGKLALTTGSIIIGASSVGAALDVKGDGKILVGNGTTATSVAISGDCTLANAGAMTVTDLTISGETAGDIIYFNGSNWIRLAKPGAGTKYLQGGTTPSWTTVSAGVASDLTNSVTINNTTNDVTLTSTDQTAAGESIVIPDFNAGGTTHTLAFLNVAQAWIGAQTFQNSGIHILDTNASHDLVIVAGSDLTADRNLTFTTGDAARTITLGGAITTTGDLITVGDDSITLTTTGATDVTLPTTGTLATLAGSESLSTKTLTAPKIVTTDGIFDGGGDAYIKFTEDAAAKTFVTITNAATTVAPIIGSGGDTADIGLRLTGKGTGMVTICDSTTIGKAMKFSLVGATDTKTTTLTFAHTDNRAITFPDATDTLVGKATGDVFTNKSFDCDGAGNVLTNVNITELDPVGDAACGIEVVYQKSVANLAAAGTNICGATNPKMRIIDAWFVATSADTGTIAVHAGQVGSVGASIVTAFTIPADDMQVTHCDEIDDAAWDLAANTGLVAVGDGGASIDGVIFVKCLRVD